ncbi:MAG: serine/threonine protein kinase [Mycobacterium sp.]|nr:MAG: serine/threonine protein kinase [Mycobacterium sp.]
MPLANGQAFAGYTIIRLLGSGGMGEVYLAQHPRLPRRDALKLLPRDWSTDPEYRARFNREADLASTLWHPHIVGVHDRGEEEDGQLWISMDFVDGLDAARLLADRYPAGMPGEEVARIVTAVASALDYAHKQGLLHRDVKPANIMLTHTDDDGEQRILLTDFGIARDVNEISGLTATNMTVGTVAYSAPEQLLGEDLDGRTDQYALAATAYHLLTGSHLFPHSNPIVVSNRHINNPPPPLAKTRPQLANLDPILAVALAKDPDDRFQRCSDFARALSEEVGSVSGGTSASAPTRPAYIPQRSRRGTINRSSRLWPTAAAAALLILVLGVWAWQPWNPAKPPIGETTRTSPSSIPVTSAQAAPPPPALQPSTSAAPPPTTTTAVDAYRYAVPGCYFNEDRLAERPTTFTFQTCADGSRRLEAMSWSSWGSSGAQGTGIFSYQVCEPNCAQGHRVQYAANVSAFNPRPAGYNSGCPTDVLFYSEMIVWFPASAPSASEIGTGTPYLGRPAVRFTTSPEGTGQDFLGNPLCD